MMKRENIGQQKEIQTMNHLQISKLLDEVRSQNSHNIQASQKPQETSILTSRRPQKVITSRNRLNNTCITLPFFEISSFVEELLEKQEKLQSSKKEY